MNVRVRDEEHIDDNDIEDGVSCLGPGKRIDCELRSWKRVRLDDDELSIGIQYSYPIGIVGSNIKVIGTSNFNFKK